MLEALEVLARSEAEVRARVPVTDALKQPLGLVHGGVFATIADALTTGPDERALSNQTSFLRPITDGAVNAHARRRHRGRTTAVWEVDITDDDGRLCALVRVTVAPACAPAAGTRS
jgi:1,4-dihydroxy-2-naphthoyl-CoA hydrolase